MKGPGALASAMLSAAVAGRADPARFGRGRDYARAGAVVSVTAEPGLLTGQVVGSRRSPYQVTVTVPGLGRRATELLDDLGQRSLNELVPTPRELRPSCSCPDDVPMCKHAVAVVLAFAQQVALEPRLLADWRSTPANVVVLRPVSTVVEAERPVTPSRALRSARSGAPEALTPLPAEVVTFLGDPEAELPELPELDELPVVCPPLGDIDVADVVDDALDVIRFTYLVSGDH